MTTWLVVGVVVIALLAVPQVRWAVFGNDEDGLYGLYPHTPLGAVQWWLRNPAHNLTHHVINWPGGPLYRGGSVPGWNWYIGFRGPQGVFGMALRKETSVG